MTSERIVDFREIVLPFLSKTLLETNYENMGKSDAEEFTRDFNEILDLAIKALEQEPLIVPIAEIKYDEDKLKELVSKCVLTVTPQDPRWISVSEKLPKAEYGESDSVLVCFENGTQDVLYFDGSNWRYPTGESYISVNYKNGWHNKVLAWMPLPKPYEPQESEDKG